MGVARDFGPWGLNAREFRRAGLNPRWWLARRVNQSATDGMGGVAIFCVKRRGPLPAGRPPPFRGAARTPSLPRTPFLRRRGPLPAGRPPPFRGAARTPSLPRTPFLRRRGPPLFRGPPLSTAVDPSPPFRLRGADPLSSTDPLSLLPRTPPHHSVSVGADPLSSTDPLSLLPRTPPHHSAVSRRGPALFHGPLSLLPRTPPHHSAVRRRGPPLFHGPLSLFRCPGGADPLSSTDTLSLLPRPPPHHSVDRRPGPPLSTAAAPSPPFRRPGGADRLWPSPRTPGARVLMRMVEGAGRRENFAQNGARGEILSPFSLGGGGMKACKI
ncbi:hypothetical protein niasHT_021270 [Heterodera trifolii]|uniref:Uncharacterized protein n=1 Tax=Heterodera trifolii TaxID=157864 RepID=A0ABD2JND1_9BILA